jgi:hypothetical protein
VIAATAAVVVAAGLTAWLVWPSEPTLTYQGRRIADPGAVLTAAESSVHALVTTRHGVDSAATRCYFTEQRKAGSGSKKTDVDALLRCGPVLFVDGDRAKTYLSIPLTSAPDSGSKVTLTPGVTPRSNDPDAVPDSVRLVRPDGKKARTGAAELTVPQPPPAEKDVLTTSDLGPTKAPKALANARMIGKSTGVALVSSGFVPRYGSGDGARSAPAGMQLLAFQVRDERGELDAATAADKLTLKLGPGRARPVPATESDDEYVIATVPAGRAPTLVLDEGGYRQTLALPAGKPGKDNLAVLTRRHRSTVVGKTVPVPVTISGAGGSLNLTLTVSLRNAGLDFWLPRYADKHPTKPGDALLALDLSYTEPEDPGQVFGFDPQLLKLKLPDGRTFSARNLASAGKVFDVFEVPAGFTSGTLQITGSEQVDAVTLTVNNAARFQIVIPAG